MAGRMARHQVLLGTLVFGLLWNILGWLGNNLLLGEAWDAVGERLVPSFAAPWNGLVRELVSLASDFIYAFAFVWLFARMQDRTTRSAIGLVLVIWLAGAATTYLAIVNSGFLPLSIALQTGMLALVIFVVTAPLLPWALRRVEKHPASP
ncbi:MAG TPA: hypothetical protein VFR29_03285 [Steroidobacteraceae bacterium]|nr:hypothetical protein [Steroidobacteraceae bacterium]